MSLKRLALCIATLSLALGWAVTAQAVNYSLVGGGGQWQIGGGLPLPIQNVNFTANGAPTNVGTNFPPLLIAPKLGTIINATASTMSAQLTIPTAVFSKPATQLTLGQFGQNPNLYAVATNLQFEWPGETVVFNSTARTGAKTTTFSTTVKLTTLTSPNATATSGQRMKVKYSNVLASKFGGPGRFRVTPGPTAGLMPQVPVTIYAIAVKGPGNPPCTHPAFIPPLGGTNNNSLCIAGIGQAVPTVVTPNATANANLGVIGGPVLNSMTTPGGTPNALVTTGTPNAPGSPIGPVPGVFVGAWDANGDFLTFGGGTNALAPTGGSMGGFTNMATTFGFPWTTGMVVISAPQAAGAAEVFTLTGMNNRTAGGAGSIQLVSGGLGLRTQTGENANRGWVELVLAKTTVVPSMSPTGLAAAAGLILLAAGYAARRRFTR